MIPTAVIIVCIFLLFSVVFYLKKRTIHFEILSVLFFQSIVFLTGVNLIYNSLLGNPLFSDLAMNESLYLLLSGILIFYLSLKTVYDKLNENKTKRSKTK